MMISTTTPALLFPAISLLLLAYTNRFIVLAQLIRQFSHEERTSSEGVSRHRDAHRRQVVLLNQRIGYIKYMQALGIVSFIICTASMGCLFIGFDKTGASLFAISLIALVISLLYALVEVLVSTKALSVEIETLFSDE